jgi:hypothetical protein
VLGQIQRFDIAWATVAGWNLTQHLAILYDI